MRKYLKIFLIDIFSYFVIFLLTIQFQAMVNAKIDSVEAPPSLYDLTEEKIDELASTMKSSYYYLLSVVIIYLLLMILVWSFSRAILWRLSMNKKLTKDIWKIIPVGILWFGMGILIMIVIFTTFNQPILINLIFSLIFIYFSNLLFLESARKGKIFKLNIHLFLSFIILAFFFAAMLVLLSFLIKYTLGYIFGIAIYFIFMIWSRFYFIQAEKRGV